MKQSKKLKITWNQKSKCTLDSALNEKQTHTHKLKKIQQKKTGETE